MKYSFSLFFVAVFFIGNSLAQTSGESSEEVRQAIQENFQQMGQAMAAGDAQRLAEHFTEDAMLQLPDSEPLVGREAIADAHEKMIEQGLGIKPTTKEVDVLGDMAFETGTAQFLNKNGETVDQVNYITIWKKENGQWLISRDVISSPNGKLPIDQTDTEKDHLYVELWNPKQAWMDLSAEERQAFFDKVGGEIQKLTEEGIEIVGFAVNDDETPYRSDHKYMAVWKMPSKEHVEMLEESVSQAGWYNYFEQVNARGELLSPPAALEDMVKFE